MQELRDRLEARDRDILSRDFQLSQLAQNQYLVNTITNKLDGITNGLSDGFYAVNTSNLQGFNGIQRDLCAGFNSVNNGIAENRFAAQQCC